MTENTTLLAAPTMTTIELLGKAYQIKCEENEIPALKKAAEYLNNTMQVLPHTGKPLVPEKLGIMAALNLASQIVELEQQMNEQTQRLHQRLHNLQTKLENALNHADPSASFHLEVESA